MTTVETETAVDPLAEYPPSKRYFTVREAATVLGVDRRRVYQFIDEGRLATVSADTVTKGAAVPIMYYIERAELSRFAAIERVNGVKLS